jgi:hypothetical protein
MSCLTLERGIHVHGVCKLFEGKVVTPRSQLIVVLFTVSAFATVKFSKMAAPVEIKSGAKEMELNEKTTVENIDDVSSSDEVTLQRTETTMNKAKWLACVALCLAYTTAYQQNACTSAILKHIDEKLGIFNGKGTM